MVRSLPLPLVLAVTAGAVSLLACAVPPHALAPPPPVDVISINVTGCATDQIGIVVQPWTAWVARGRALRWSTPAGVDSVAIEAVDPARWPFQWGPGPGPQAPQQSARQQPARQRRVAPGGQPIQAGTVPANAPVGQTYRYRILVYCDGRVLDIDPDLIIRDPY